MTKKILLVEDNEGDQMLIKEALEENGLDCELFITTSGEDGLSKATALKPDIVITDTNLPGMDGFETCQKIKEACGDCVKIIVMTGVVDAVNAGKARDMGADEYCVKTSDCQPLLVRLMKYFKK